MCAAAPGTPKLAAGLGVVGLDLGADRAAPAAGLVAGVTVGAWLGWPAALLVAVLAWSRLRFRPSAEVGIWQQQAAMQRRTAGSLAPLADEGYLVLHDVTLPGLLDSLEHLVVGPSGVWVLQSWQRQGRRPPVPPCRPGSWSDSVAHPGHRRGAGRLGPGADPAPAVHARRLAGNPAHAQQGHPGHNHPAARPGRPLWVAGGARRGG